LQVFRRPGDTLDNRREVGSFAEAHPRSVGERRRTQSTQQRKDPGDITGPAAVGR
jgi:hypothetical protein